MQGCGSQSTVEVLVAVVVWGCYGECSTDSVRSPLQRAVKAWAVRLLTCLAGPAPGIEFLQSILDGHLVFSCSRDSVGGPLELQVNCHKASRGPPGFLSNG